AHVEGLDNGKLHDTLPVAGVVRVADLLAMVRVGVPARLHALAERAHLVARHRRDRVRVTDLNATAVTVFGLAADRGAAATLHVPAGALITWRIIEKLVVALSALTGVGLDLVLDRSASVALRIEPVGGRQVDRGHRNESLASRARRRDFGG